MTKQDGDGFGDWSDENSTVDRGSLPSGSDSGHSIQSSQSHQSWGLGTGHRTHPLTVDLPQHLATCRALSTTSTNSTGSYLVSYTTRVESGVSSISPAPPGNPASRQPAGTASESSADPILLQLVRQISSFSSDSAPSVDTIDSEDTGSGNQGSEEDEAAETPDTSEAGSEDVDFFIANEVSLALTPNGELSYVGLEFPKELRDTQWSTGTDNANDDGDDDLNKILDLHTNPQARPDAASWAPTKLLARPPDPAEIALAPPAGEVYKALHSSIKKYTQDGDKSCNKKKLITATFQGQSASTGPPSITVTGKPRSNHDTTVLAQSSKHLIKSRHTPFQDGYNTGINPEIYHPVSDSQDTHGIILHPDFLVSHLSQESVSTFTRQLCAAIDASEYPVEFSLGFRPHICLQVSPFAPKDRQTLRSFQKHEGNDKLDVKDSLPIVLTLFSIDTMAERLDAWFDKIVDSKSDLLDYVSLMMKRHAENLSAKSLQAVVSWFLKAKSKLLEPAHKILRTALKLLLTTSALILVPRVIDLPVSLSTHLSLQSSPGGSSSAVPSFDAPKLLSRQIKSGSCYLQKKLLPALFSELLENELLVEVRLSVALIVSFVLELMRKVARDFARYANEIDPTVFVDERDVNDYERSMENLVFGTLRASVYGSRGSVDGEMGELVDRLRDLKSTMKGKGKEEDCQFVSAILTPLF